MKKAVVTGASSGIGEAIALELADKNYDLLLVARREPRLLELKERIERNSKVRVQFISVDLTLIDGAQKVFDFCREKNFFPEILVNNAGRGICGEFQSLSLDDLQSELLLNMCSLMSLTHLFIPQLIKNNEKSYILNVGSSICYQASPYFAHYAATKVYVKNLTRALSHELSPYNIQVSLLNPGATKTEFIANSKAPHLKINEDRFGMLPREVAQVALNGLFNGKREIIPGLINRMPKYASKILPARLLEYVALRVFRHQG